MRYLSKHVDVNFPGPICIAVLVKFWMNVQTDRSSLGLRNAQGFTLRDFSEDDDFEVFSMIFRLLYLVWFLSCSYQAFADLPVCWLTPRC